MVVRRLTGHKSVRLTRRMGRNAVRAGCMMAVGASRNGRRGSSGAGGALAGGAEDPLGAVRRQRNGQGGLGGRGGDYPMANLPWRNKAGST